jgi:hypothetical protein
MSCNKDGSNRNKYQTPYNVAQVPREKRKRKSDTNGKKKLHIKHNNLILISCLAKPMPSGVSRESSA